MIQLKIRNMNHKTILTVPAEYERVKLALWTLGLDRDPEKYTLQDLGAEFSCTCDEESHMIQLISPSSTLMGALIKLSEMVYPPYPAAKRIHKKMAAGEYASGDDFFIELENLVYSSNVPTHSFCFPVSGEVVDIHGMVQKAPDALLLKYELLISEAIQRVQSQISGSETKLFEDVDGVYQKLLGATWSADSLGGFLMGEVCFSLTRPLTEEEIESAVKKIEMINSTLFPIKLKNWSVMTDEGLLFVNLCDEDGDYSLYDFETKKDEDEYDGPCVCPECQALMRKPAASEGAELEGKALEKQTL